ncbi:MFS transporter [Nocardioides mangrovicus]|uniref:MFS transporter n=2 Tax=Nocardioides mangrovicus TaxID=2478913 RepID=A0A3L8P758_9ACTN|nr:MFS transporter [Nocardioides mangrovicus]
MLICNQLDRGNIAFAQEHLEADVGLGDAAYGLGAGVFFIAYAIFEVPSNLLMERFGPKIWLTRIMITWGLVSAGMALVQGERSFYVLRFLLGVAEAGFFPAIIYYFTRWVPNSHRGRAIALFIAGSSIAAAISGPLSVPLLSMHLFGLTGWQSLFVAEGALSVVIGVVAYAMLDSRIEDATWLSAEERTALADVVAAEDAERTRRAEQTAGQAKPSRLRVLVDPTVLGCCAIFFACSMAIYATTFWLPSILHDIPGAGDTEVGWLSAIPWVFAIGAAFGFNRVADRHDSHRRWLVLTLVVAAVATMISAFTGPWGALALLTVGTMCFKAASSLFWAVPERSMHPAVLAPAIAIINSLGNLGGFVAPYGFGVVKAQTGTVSLALVALALFGLLAAVLAVFVGRRRRTPPMVTSAAPAV